MKAISGEERVRETLAQPDSGISWQLRTERGAQRWSWVLSDRLEREIQQSGWDSPGLQHALDAMESRFRTEPQDNPNAADNIWRGPSGVLKEKASSLDDSIGDSIRFIGSYQSAEGHWPSDYGGPMFLLPGMVFIAHLCNTPLDPPTARLVKRYMLNRQNADGGWGLHIEGESTVFGSVMQYVALRLLGEKSSAVHMIQARDWIQHQGGACGIPSWGKFYLALLGLYDWQGINSLLPETWLLPKSAPIHPWRYWCHCRMVYLPMAYLYGKRVTATDSPLLKELRSEIHTENYDDINWKAQRDRVSATDRFHESSSLLKWFNRIVNTYESIHIPAIRKRAMAFIAAYIGAEDEQTNYIDIGPVNQLLNTAVCWHLHGSDSMAFKSHIERWKDYLWLAEDGMKMQGYNGSQLWDCAFMVRAIAACDFPDEAIELSRKAFGYIDQSQIREEVDEREKFFRHPSVGGWPFSTRDHGWPITDCTAEGLKACLDLLAAGVVDSADMPAFRLEQAVDLILGFQNDDGGWATYELARGPRWLELLNPSEVYADIMIDYSYTECSSAAIQALAAHLHHSPDYRVVEITRALEKGMDYILSRQREDGSWYGSWGVCFTYGSWFGVEALAALRSVGIRPEECTDRMEQAAAFLLKQQLPDGGWGEHHRSCMEYRYVSSDESQVVQSSWAMLALMHTSGDKAAEAVESGIGFLKRSQLDNGDWPQQGISGVFNANCMISYTNYRNIFPTRALGRYRQLNRA